VQVVSAEAKLGLTLKSEVTAGLLPVTVVKSTVGGAHCISCVQVSGVSGLPSTPYDLVSKGEEFTRCAGVRFAQEGDILLSVNGESVVTLELSDVLYILKTADRPIRLRFRSCSQTANSARSRAHRSALSDGPAGGSLFEALAPSFFAHLRDRQEDRDDSDSQDAVFSESFGDADSSQTTENSSVVTDLNDSDVHVLRRSSRLSNFLRKPFRRTDGLDFGRPGGLRSGVVPPPPRVTVVIESPCKVLSWDHPSVSLAAA
jgi:hypothetical protein